MNATVASGSAPGGGQDGREERIDPARGTGPARVGRVRRPGDRGDVGDPAPGGQRLEAAPPREVGRPGDPVDHDRAAAGRSVVRLPQARLQHRQQRRDASPGGDVDRPPRVGGVSGEEPLRASEPQPVAGPEGPEPRRQGAAGDEPDQELEGVGLAAGRGGRVGALERTAVHLEAEGQVLAGLERGHAVVRADPEPRDAGRHVLALRDRRVGRGGVGAWCSRGRRAARDDGVHVRPPGPARRPRRAPRPGPRTRSRRPTRSPPRRPSASSAA